MLLLRLISLLALSAAVFFLVNAAQPIVEQNRKVRDWPAVDMTVSAWMLDRPQTKPTTALTAAASATAPATMPILSAAPARPGDVLIRYREYIGTDIRQRVFRRSLDT